MPELPEVETVCRGIAPSVLHNTIVKTQVRQRQLRWPIHSRLHQKLKQQTVQRIWRRAKYIILGIEHGHLLIHLGMSGSLQLCDAKQTPGKHDHVDFMFADGCLLRYNDPRRFGAILWTTDALEQHPRLCHLGVEPLTSAFNAKYLHQQCSNRHVAIKNRIMDQGCVVGVGNIYASEALFMAGIHPHTSAEMVSLDQCKQLVQAIKKVLRLAIKQGGTTLKNFSQADGKPGYFKQSLQVYGRNDQPCPHCDTPIQKSMVGQRSCFFCPCCQPEKK